MRNEYPWGVQYLKIALNEETIAVLYLKPCYISSKMQIMPANNNNYDQCSI